jgi:hypothetical protein
VGPNKSFHFYGRGAWVASFRGNSVKGQQLGNITVEFGDGTAVHFTPLPEVWIRGILMGDRVMEYLGKTQFTYPAFGLSCEVHFNPDSGLLKWMRGKSTPSDMLKGEIVQACPALPFSLSLSRSLPPMPLWCVMILRNSAHSEVR